MRITPNNITKLQDNEIFVFGSNESGIHGAGAAKQAREFGAILGNGFGLWGKTYAIPTKGPYAQYVLHIGKIKIYVDEFIKHCISHPENVYLVTEIGCGLAGLKPKEIGPLFQDAKDIENIHLPERFWKYIK